MAGSHSAANTLLDQRQVGFIGLDDVQGLKHIVDRVLAAEILGGGFFAHHATQAQQEAQFPVGVFILALAVAVDDLLGNPVDLRFHECCEIVLFHVQCSSKMREQWRGSIAVDQQREVLSA